jgi:hypothetical protein
MDEETDFNELSTKFECVKIGFRHSKDGHILQLAIHPDDTPHDLLKDFLGQRYLAVLVRMDADDQPVADKGKEEGKKAINMAMALCKDEEFQMWMASAGMAEEPTEEAAVNGLKDYLGIKSRKDLLTDKAARERLAGLRAEFAAQFARR